MTFRKEQLAENVTDRWVTIYALCQPIEKWKTGDVRYVGKTAGFVWHRVRAHSYAAKRANPRLPVHRWLRKQIDAGLPFHIKHLERIPPGEDWVSRERYWIEKYRAKGVKLLNLTDGGDGLAGLPRSAEHRAKIAAALRKGGEFACETCGASFWRKANQIRRGQNKFCSRACYSASNAGVSRPVSIQCVEAGVAAAAAKRRAQTHCKRGHELSGPNVYLNPRGVRVCKECRRLHKTKHRSVANG
jgi:hypothetical protein